MAQVRRHVRIPIATGERLYTKFPFFELIKARGGRRPAAGPLQRRRDHRAEEDRRHRRGPARHHGAPQHQQPHRHRGQRSTSTPSLPNFLIQEYHAEFYESWFFDLVPDQPRRSGPHVPLPAGPGPGDHPGRGRRPGPPPGGPSGLGRAWHLSPAPSSSTWTGRWWTLLRPAGAVAIAGTPRRSSPCSSPRGRSPPGGPRTEPRTVSHRPARRTACADGGSCLPARSGPSWKRSRSTRPTCARARCWCAPSIPSSAPGPRAPSTPT